MQNEKPAPGGNRAAGYHQDTEFSDNSSKTASRKPENTRPIGEIVPKLIGQIAAQIDCAVRP